MIFIFIYEVLLKKYNSDTLSNLVNKMTERDTILEELNEIIIDSKYHSAKKIKKLETILEEPELNKKYTPSETQCSNGELTEIDLIV